MISMRQTLSEPARASQPFEAISSSEGHEEPSAAATWSEGGEAPGPDGAPAFDLPTDFPRAALASTLDAGYTFSLPEQLRAAVVAMAGHDSGRLYSLLLSAFHALLARYADQENVVVWIPCIGGRGTSSEAGHAGTAYSLRPVAANLSADPSITTLIEQIEPVVARVIHDCSRDSVLRADGGSSQGDRSAPAGRVVFNLWETAPESPHRPYSELLELGSTAARHVDLALDLRIDADSLTGTVLYVGALFSAATIAGLVGSYETLLAGLVAQPQRPLSRLPLLSPAAQERLLAQGRGAPAPPAASLVRLFAAQVARTPHAPALRCGDQTLSYAALDARARALAHVLRRHGVGPEVPVALCVERSVEMIVAVLAILKAGGAYVPLDPRFPAARLAYMLADSGAALVLTAEALRATLPLSAPRVLCLDTLGLDTLPAGDTPDDVVLDPDQAALDSGSDQGVFAPAEGAFDAEPEPEPEQLAYVMYTSGSTGQPKGVLVTHAAVARLVCDPTYVTLGPQDRVLGLAPLSFDASTFEIWGSLLNGACLTLLPPAEFSLDGLSRLLRTAQISTLWLTAGLFHQMVEHDAASLRGVRQVLAGGDVLSPAHVRTLLDPDFSALGTSDAEGADSSGTTERSSSGTTERGRAGARAGRGQGRGQVINGYGPTENTTFTCCYRVPAPPPERGSVPIGYPIGGTEVYVLDAQMQPVPPGVEGELYIGGRGLARGYLRQAGLTAQRFVPHPYSTEPGARLYRSGDRVRYGAQGALEFLGRRDGQVKLRGFRVEPGEVAAVLEGHAAVRQAVVVVDQDAQGDKRLVAYVVLATAPTAAAAREAGETDATREAAEADGAAGSARAEDAARAAGIISSEGELRRYLGERLPAYMLPAAIVPLAALPLTANGKVDYRALPPVAAGEHERAAALEGDAEAVVDAPRTPLEEVIGGIWAAVLGGARVGRTDNFFALGGHSLRATQVLARVRAALGVEIGLPAFFAAPTVEELAALVEQAQRRQDQAQAQQAQGAGADGEGRALPPLVRRASRSAEAAGAGEAGGAAGGVPSFAQQRLWFLDQLVPGSSAQNIPTATRLRGALDRTALERSLTEIVRRHEALRSVFPTVDGAPGVVATPPEPVVLATINLRSLPAAAREAEVQRLIAHETHEPFDLSAGPLLRGALLELGADDHVLLLTMHHIVSDGWSLSILWRELAVLYDAYTTGRPSPLSDLPIQFGDYAQWQRDWLAGAVMTEQLTYWQTQLANATPVLDLPTDYSRPTVQTYRGDSRSTTLPESLTHDLIALSRREGVTLFMTLLAALQTLLARHSGQEDFMVGAPVAGRTHSETEHLIGFFVNTLVLRADLSGDPTFRELLGRVRRTCLGAYAHQDMPFERLVEMVQVERDLSRNPLFQVFFNMINIPSRAPMLSGLDCEDLPIEEAESKFDLTLYVEERGSGIALKAHYNADLFAGERIEELLAQYHLLLSQVVSEPAEHVSHLNLVTEKARAVLPRPDAPLDATWYGSVAEGFARRAQRAPGQLAIQDEAEAWTYGELEARSNQLAAYLHAHGVTREDVVAIYAHRSAALVWALLGTIKAGAAFMILDPAYPPARLIDCLRQAPPRGWLQLAAAGPLPAPLEEVLAEVPPRCRLVLPRHGADSNLLIDYPGDPFQAPVGPDDLACIAFTSGSTGRPKGILGRHGSLSHFMPWQQRRYDLRSSDRYSMLSGLSHDPLQRDIFTPLWYGATICIPTPDEIGTPGRLAAWMQREKISVANLTPAMLQLLTHAAADKHLDDLLYAFVVGDVLMRQDVARLYALAPRVQCVAHYGSSETQRAVGYTIIPREPTAMAPYAGGPMATQRDSIALGTGIEDAQLLVLNGALELAGCGELGEIHMRSPHLARGYLGDDALTAQRFLTNPFTGLAQDRLYRTGDLGRYRLDGAVEFAGRADRQVKLRGYRIELGEIEAVLARQDCVRECAVVMWGDEPAERRLVAYVVPAAGQAPTATALRAALAGHLPEYMVPAAFVPLDALPLTPNGKLDRRALPEPQSSHLAGTSEAVAPRDAVETLLADLWATVLNLDEVGINDNFFALGGHSLLVTRLMAHVHSLCAIKLPLRVFFECPTIAEQARALRAAPEGRDRLEAVARRVVDLSHADDDIEDLLLNQDALKERTVL